MAYTEEELAEERARYERSEEWCNSHPVTRDSVLADHFHFIQDGPQDNALGLCYYSEERARMFCDYLEHVVGSDFFHSMMYAEDLDMNAPAELKELITPEDIKEALADAGADPVNPLHWHLILWQGPEYAGPVPDPKLHGLARALIKLGIEPMDVTAEFTQEIIQDLLGLNLVAIF